MAEKPTYEELEKRIKELEQVESDHKRSEKALKKSKERLAETNTILAGVLEYTHIMAAFLDSRFNFIWVNHAYAATDDHEPSFFLGKNHFDLYPHEENQAIFQRVVNTGEPFFVAAKQFEYPNNPERGMTYWDWSLVPVKDDTGKVIRLVFTLAEVTERKAAEEELRETTELLQSVLDNAADEAIITTDQMGIILIWNEGARRFLGYKSEEVVGRENIRIFHTEEYLKSGIMDVNIKKIIATGKSLTEELDYVTKDGKTIPVQQIVSPRFDDDGKFIGMVGMVRDITERKQADEALRENEEKLARSKKMESLALLAGGVAHDLNNVLSGIVSYPELILIDLPKDSKFRKPIETMQESGHRAAAIVQDLLTVARGVATTKEPLNLNDLVGDYLHSPEFNKLKQFHPTVTVKTNLDTDLFNISGSHVHIRKVVMNLVSNASEAIEGGGNVTISTTNRYVDRPLRGYDDVNIGEYVVLSVSDDGSGISSDDLERIFEPFYTKKVMGRSGTGLGLAVVWNTVQDHKGYIDVTSDENGTTFELYFPITREEISGKDLSIPIKDYKGNQETILVVDDEESQREISCKMLDTLGYKTKAVSSGEDAVEYLKENTVDLILLDMIMDPGINGRETYERIIKIHPKQKAIIVSGFAETDEVKEAQKLGAGKYIKKPVTLERIGLTVKEELEK